MPLPQPPAETVKFDGLIDQMSERLAFEDKEKLSDFVRVMIKKTLVFIESKNHQKVSFEQAVYSLVSSSRRLDAKLELKVLVVDEGASDPKGVCSIALKESEYMGSPDGLPKASTGLVKRKRISVVEVKNEKTRLWTGATAILKGSKRSGDFVSHLDIQVKP